MQQFHYVGIRSVEGVASWKTHSHILRHHVNENEEKIVKLNITKTWFGYPVDKTRGGQPTGDGRLSCQGNGSVKENVRVIVDS